MHVVSAHLLRSTADLFAYRILFFSSIGLISLSTAHIGMSLRQLLDAFVDPAVVSLPHGADVYFARTSHPISLAQNSVYLASVSSMCQSSLLYRSSLLCQRSVLRICCWLADLLYVALIVFLRANQMWRLYVVWANNWKILILPVSILAC